MSFMACKSRRKCQEVLLRQPDSLKLSCSLAVLKNLHRVANDLDAKFGDKTPDRTFFLKGIQGKVSRPNWSHDHHTYFLGKVEEVRYHLSRHCVQSALDDLSRIALNIYNRFDNLRRMGVEILVLAMLANKNSQVFEIPDKYDSPLFVQEMLVSYRHRFLKPDKCYFWSRLSESLILSTLGSVRNLTKLKLAIVNDHLLKGIAVHCRKLQDLEIQFALDVSDEGLFALAGKALSRTNGKKKSFDSESQWTSQALSLHRDFKPAHEWFIKDSLLFTPPLQSSRHVPPSDMGGKSGQSGAQSRVMKVPLLEDTGFGCLDLMRLRINGQFVFPPLARRYMELSTYHTRTFKGPQLEVGFYVMLANLKKLERWTMSGLPMVIATRPEQLWPNWTAETNYPALSLRSLTFDRDLMHPEELEFLTLSCCNVQELVNVAPEICADHVLFGAKRYSTDLCQNLKNFRQVRSFQGRMPLICFNEFLHTGNAGVHMTRVHLNTEVFHLYDILLLRRFAPNLETLVGKFSFDINAPPPPVVNVHLTIHDDLAADALGNDWKAFDGDEGRQIQRLKDVAQLLSHYPMKKLRKIDLEGTFTILSMQLIVGNVEFLEDFSLTNSPAEDVSEFEVTDKCLSDDWLDALVHVNSLTNIKSLTLRLDNDRTVEVGWFSERGLIRLLTHCNRHSPKLRNLVGEFTRIPDKTLTAIVTAFAVKGLSHLHVANAVPYRRFENSFETERHYSVNEGYHQMLRELSHHHPHHSMHYHYMHQHHHQEDPQQQVNNRDNVVERSAVDRGDGRYSGYVFRPFPTPLSGDEDREGS